MQFVPYNAFQKIMRLWDEVHPYNAAQIMKLQGTGDYDQINTQWHQTLKTLGIGRVVMQGDTYAHCAWQNEPGSQFIDVARPEQALDAFLSEDINRPFPGPDYCPFRPFLIQEDGFHYLGVVYHHWPADSGSIKTLLREWFLNLYQPDQARTRPLQIPVQGLWHYYGPHKAHWSFYDAALSLLRHRTRFGRVRHTPIRTNEDFTVRISIHPQPDGLADRLLTTARKLGVTVNDLFLAALAESNHHFGACPQTADRDELALGTIVDLRMLTRQNMDHLFGMFLGFTNVIVRRQDLNNWQRLVQRIARQTRFQKKQNAAQASILRMGGALAEAHFLPARKWIDVYRQRLPMSAGISNINMNRHWTAAFTPAPLIEYIRIAPTSAQLPLTLGTTTTGNKMNVTMTRQVSFFDELRSGQMLERFLSHIHSV